MRNIFSFFLAVLILIASFESFAAGPPTLIPTPEGKLVITPEERNKELETCKNMRPEDTVVNVRLFSNAPEFIMDQAKVDLIRNDKEIYKKWLKSSNLYELWWANDLISEYMFTGWALHAETKIRQMSADKFSLFHCAYYTEVNVNIYYQSLIYIPTEYRPNSCGFGVVYDHVVAHHDINVETISEYAIKLKEDLIDITPTLEPVAFPTNHQGLILEKMEFSMNQTIALYITEKVEAEIKKLHYNLDSLKSDDIKKRMLKNCEETGDPYKTLRVVPKKESEE